VEFGEEVDQVGAFAGGEEADEVLVVVGGDRLRRINPECR